MKRGWGNRGFTIVELLIVVVVIAILTVIAIVAYTDFSRRAYESRAMSELSAISRAVRLYYADRGHYPEDVVRNIPVSIFDYSGSESPPGQWPQAPWPGSVYDYDVFMGSDDKEVVQISIRFCPLGGSLSDCKFPSTPWAENFGTLSSAYWCITGICRAHPSSSDDYPAYCMNCTKEAEVKTTP